MPSPDTARLDDAIRRANRHIHDAIDKPDDAGLYNFLACFVIACLKDEGHE